MESSAIVAWLLGEPDSAMVGAALDGSDEVITSDVTLVECDRGLIRARLDRRLRESDATALRRQFQSATNNWTLIRIGPPIIERARQPFPGDPIRTLDALHLATALAAAETAGDLAVLSLDRRVRGAARALGLDVVPAR